MAYGDGQWPREALRGDSEERSVNWFASLVALRRRLPGSWRPAGRYHDEMSLRGLPLGRLLLLPGVLRGDRASAAPGLERRR